jgi:hypothetical protein
MDDASAVKNGVRILAEAGDGATVPQVRPDNLDGVSQRHKGSGVRLGLHDATNLAGLRRNAAKKRTTNEGLGQRSAEPSRGAAHHGKTHVVPIEPVVPTFITCRTRLPP